MKKLLIIPFLSAFAIAASAQEYILIPKGYQDEVNATYDRITERGPYLTNKFFNNVFIGVGGGVNVYFGDYDHDGSFSDRLAPALDVNLGKWVTPSVGLRAQYTGLKVKGFSRVPGDYTGPEGDVTSDGLYEKDFDFYSIHGDVLWNLSNAIGGFRSDRFWEFVPYVGFGYAKSDKGDACYEGFAMSGGLINKLRIVDQLHITLEARGMMVDTEFDRLNERDRSWDYMASLTAGLQFTFGPAKGFKRPVYVAPADYAPYIQRIEALEAELGAAVIVAERLGKELEAEKRKEKQIVTSQDVPVSLQVFFKIGSAVVTDQGMLNLERIAQSIKAMPDKKFNVIGYADSATGSQNINTKLSQQRAEAAYKILTEKFGVNKAQLATDSKGGVKDHKNIELDRTVIIGR